MRGSSRIQSLKNSPTPSRISLSLGLLTVSAALALFGQTTPPLKAVPTRDSKIIKRWALPGDPRGLALGNDGTVYVGLAQTQEVVAVDPKTGAVLKRVVLDSAEIASTKELVTMRTNPERTRLYIANGSDESATILSLPDLSVVREITMEGEEIRDVLPDPKGRYVYVLGRTVHVFDAGGQREIRSIDFEDPMAIAATASGNALAVLGSEDFGNTRATVVALYDTTSFHEMTRDPLQTDKVIEAALFAANDRALVAMARDSLFEKPLHTTARPQKTLQPATAGGHHRMRIDFGDLVNSERICLPERSGPQIVTSGASNMVIFAERRCSASGTFAGSNRRISPASLYGVAAYALAYERDTLYATDRAGYLTIYKVPRVAVAH